MKFISAHNYSKKIFFLITLIFIAVQYRPAFSDEKWIIINPHTTIIKGIAKKISGPPPSFLFNTNRKAIANEIDGFARRMKLNGKINLSKATMDKNITGKASFASGMLPDNFEWKIGADPGSNYLNGKLKIGKNIIIQGSFGSESDIKALLVFPF